MNNEILKEFAKIRVYQDKNGPALHKPLLALFMLSRCFHDKPRLASFQEIDRKLNQLLRLFYPEGSIKHNTHYPFGKLENDGIWEVRESQSLSRTSAGHLLRNQLIDLGIHGGFLPEIYNQLIADNNLTLAAADLIANRFFDQQTKVKIFRTLDLPSETLEALASSSARSPHSDPDPVQHKEANLRIKLAQKVSLTVPNETFISYLNSLHSLQASGANALAESQAMNPFFGDLYEPVPLVASLEKLLRDCTDRVVILSGHAGDGKSTIALDIYKKLNGLPPAAALDKPLRERESISLDGQRITIVKDMSELGADQRQDWLLEAFSADTGNWLIVSNTGPLLHSLRQYAKEHDRLGVESDILGELDRPLNLEHLEEHSLDGFEKPLAIVNLSRFDNTDLGARLFRRLIRHPGWRGCEDCMVHTSCPIQLNRQALLEADSSVEQRLRWIYRRISEYERRLTLRQIVAQLAYGLTGGRNCSWAKTEAEQSNLNDATTKTEALAKIIFSEGFFGFREGQPDQNAQALRAVELAHRMRLGGPVSPAYEQMIQENSGEDLLQLPQPLHELVHTWRNAKRNTPTRTALRRLLLLFAQPRPGRESEGAEFFDVLLRSPGLRLLDESRQKKRLALNQVEVIRLRKACMEVLREAFSGFTASQFDSRDDELYLTLRRLDRTVIQPTQLVVGGVSFRDFELHYGQVTSLPTLEYMRDRTVVLPLSLPLLDHILRRADGEIGYTLAPIHQAQLDSFRARLMSLKESRSRQEGEITLLRADIRGHVSAYRYILDKDLNGEPQRLVQQR